MKEELDILKKEELAMNNSLKEPITNGSQIVLDDPNEVVEMRMKLPITKAIINTFETLFEKKLGKVLKVELSNQPRVQVDFPKEQQVTGKVSILNKIVSEITNFPSIFKVQGDVNASVKFPEVQKITGNVKAEVDFPKIQDVSLKDIEKLIELVKAIKFDVPIATDSEPNTKTTNPTRYIPVRLTNGRGFYDVFTESIGSQGRVASKIEELIALLLPSSVGNVVNNGQTKIAVTNTAVPLSNVGLSIKNGVIVQALAGNVNKVYVGNSSVSATTGFELQPGQATSLAVNDVSLIYINGTANDGICFIGAK